MHNDPTELNNVYVNPYNVQNIPSKPKKHKYYFILSSLIMGMILMSTLLYVIIVQNTLKKPTAVDIFNKLIAENHPMTTISYNTSLELIFQVALDGGGIYTIPINDIASTSSVTWMEQGVCGGSCVASHGIWVYASTSDASITFNNVQNALYQTNSITVNGPNGPTKVDTSYLPTLTQYNYCLSINTDVSQYCK